MSLFKKDQTICHKKTGNNYKICEVPEQFKRLEATNESFYEYQCTTTGLVWVRSQREMEDGRFEVTPCIIN